MYQLLFPDSLTVFEEVMFGLNSIFCIPQSDKTFKNYLTCPHHFYLILFNLLCRVNYYFLLKYKVEIPELPTSKVFEKVKSFFNGFLRLVFPLSLVIFIFVSLMERFVNFNVILSLNLLLFILFRIVFVQFHNKSARHLQMITTHYYKIFMFVYFLVTLTSFAFELWIFFAMEKQTNTFFKEQIQSNLIFRSLRRNGISSKKEWWNAGTFPSKANMERESVKAVIVLVTSIFLRNWSRLSVKKEQNAVVSKHLLTSAIYLLFFVFFSINISYFISYRYDILLLKYIPTFLSFVLLLILNVLIKRFYQIGTSFQFSTIITQEMIIFRSTFTQNLKTNQFNETIFADDFWNEKYLLLKENYRKTFSRFLKNKLISKLFIYFRIYFVLFCVYFFLELNLVFLLGLVQRNIFVLYVELLIFVLAIMLMQMIGMVQSSKEWQKVKEKESLVQELKYVALLKDINDLIIECIEKRKTNDFEARSLQLESKLNDFLKRKFDLVLKTYKNDLYKQLKVIKIVLNIESKFYDMKFSTLFLNKDNFDKSTNRGVFELKSTTKENKPKQKLVIPQFNSFQNRHGNRINELTNNFFQFNDTLHEEIEGFEEEVIRESNVHGKATDSSSTYQPKDSELDIKNDLDNSVFRFTDLRRLIDMEPQLMYQESKDKLRNEEFLRLKINQSIHKKLQFWPQTNYRMNLAIFYYSVFDLVKNSIFNLYLLSICFNSNFLTPIVVICLYGIPIFKQVKFYFILQIISVSFWYRSLLSINIAKLQDNKLSVFFSFFNGNEIGFYIELLSISLTLFLFIPTFVLLMVIFEKFTRIPNPNYDKISNDTTNQQTNPIKKKQNLEFEAIASLDSKTFKINYVKWNKWSFSYLQNIREVLIEKEPYLYPLIFAIISMRYSYFMFFFEMYMVIIFIRILTGEQTMNFLRLKTRKIMDSLFGLKLLVFLFFFFVSINSIFSFVPKFDFKLIVVFVILNFKIIFKDTFLFKHRLKEIKKNLRLKREIVNFLENLMLNDGLIIRKTVSEHCYQKFISFQKYSINSKNLSPQKLMQTNILQLNYIFRHSVNLRKRFCEFFTLKMFENSRKFEAENIVFLSLLLKEKYENFVYFGLDFLEILTGDYRSIERVIATIENARNKIISGKPEIVQKYVQILEFEVDGCLSNPEAHKILKTQTESFEKVTKSRVGNTNVQHGTVSTSQLSLKKSSSKFYIDDMINDFFNQKIKNNIDLLENLEDFYSHSNAFAPTIENFAPKKSNFPISEKVDLCLFNFKYSNLLDEEQQISIGLKSLFVYFYLFVKTHVEQLLLLLYLVILLRYYGHVFFIVGTFAAFLVPIEILPVFRLNRSIVLLCFTLICCINRHYMHFSQNFYSKDRRKNMNDGSYVYEAMILFFNNDIDLKVDIVLVLLSFFLYTCVNSKLNRRYFTRNEFIGEACYRVI